FLERKGKARRSVGSAALFRLEEYKLPEFEVSVSTPEEGGRRKLFRLGDRVEATIEAQTYSGAPVAEANVEVLVHARPYARGWIPEREYPWYYADADSRRWRDLGGDQVIARERLCTDAGGRATLVVDTAKSPGGGGQDLELVIEARVTDASRREITGQ